MVGPLYQVKVYLLSGRGTFPAANVTVALSVPLYNNVAFAGSQTELGVCESVTTGRLIFSAIMKSAVEEQFKAVVTLTVYGMPPPATLSTCFPFTPDTVATLFAGRVFCPLNHSNVNAAGA